MEWVYDDGGRSRYFKGEAGAVAVSIVEVNDALQQATAKGEWIQWCSVFDDCERIDGKAMLANSHAHVDLGLLSEGLDALMAKLPEAEARLRLT